MGLFSWIAVIWLASKIMPGMQAAIEGTPKLGGSTSQGDGTIHKLPDGTPLLACAGKWWAIAENQICCAAASGTAITLSDGQQVVCAKLDALASYRWVRPGSQ